MTQILELPSTDVDRLAAEYEAKSAEDLIRWTLDSFGERAAVCTSFQVEGMVVLDLAHKIRPDVRVFTLDTGRLPQETHELIDTVRERYDIQIDIYHPDDSELDEMIGEHGTNSFYRSVSLRVQCCEIRKVNPLKRALRDLGAWMTGIRRSQIEPRAGAPKIQTDTAHGDIIKVNPLADWDSARVWEYIRKHDVPYNRLYDMGYTSIGCAPCTRPTTPGEDPRAGRWWWEKGVQKECGMHLAPRLNGSHDLTRAGSA